MEKIIEYVPTDFRAVVFCDGSALSSEDGHEGNLIRSAAWSAQTLDFVIQEHYVHGLTKGEMIKNAESMALDLAISLKPEIIYMDAKQIIESVSYLYKNVPLRWISRQYNGIADTLTKHPPGSGYLVFNSTKTGRGWLDLVYS